MAVQVVLGHGREANGNWQPGNRGQGVDEHAVTKSIMLGVLDILSHPAYKDMNWYQLNVRNSRHEFLAMQTSSIRGDIVFALHTNAFNGKAQGTETFWCMNNALSKSVAQKTQNALVGTLKTSNRGIKNGTDFRVGYYGRQYGAKAVVLIEYFFQDNKGDWNKYNKEKKKLIETMAKLIVETSGGKWQGVNPGKTPSNPNPKPNPTPSNPNNVNNNEVKKWVKTLPKNAIGILLYRTENDNERRMNVYKSDTRTKIEGDGLQNVQLTVGTNGARGVYDQKGKKMTYEKPKGRKVIGRYLPR